YHCDASTRSRHRRRPFPGTPRADRLTFVLLRASRVTKGFRFLLSAAGGGTLLDAIVPGGTSWRKSAGAPAWVLKSTAPGIRKIVIKGSAKAPGSFRIVVRGNGVSVANGPGLPVTATAVIDAPVAASGQCGEARLPVM